MGKRPSSFVSLIMMLVVLTSGCTKAEKSNNVDLSTDQTVAALSQWNNAKAMAVLPTSLTDKMPAVAVTPPTSPAIIAQMLIAGDPRIKQAVDESKFTPEFKQMIQSQAQNLAAMNPALGQALIPSTGLQGSNAKLSSSMKAKALDTPVIPPAGGDPNPPGPGAPNLPPNPNVAVAPPEPPVLPPVPAPVCPVVCAYAAAWAAVSVCAWAEASACAYATATCTNADGTTNTVHAEYCAWAHSTSCAWAAAGAFAIACAGGVAAGP